MNQISSAKLILILVISFLIYFILSFQQTKERNARFDSIEQSIEELRKDVRELQRDVHSR
ncbi:hypothetical protein [Candidatus Protochlamydia phocaeensis]|uniref:hypothetical protein n=1 Tax=Candidatus Protochlamydia phocaeensis TaxID=1414722 RepID=UPI0008380DAF|nr:hypothetical protein [Candidatus Protochlamydia phocaeensis]